MRLKQHIFWQFFFGQWRPIRFVLLNAQIRLHNSIIQNAYKYTFMNTFPKSTWHKL